MSQLWSYIIKLLKQYRLINCESNIFLHFNTILRLIWTLQPPLQTTWSSILYACCSYFPPLSTVASYAENTRTQRPWIIVSVLNGLQRVNWKPNYYFEIEILKNASILFLKIGPLIFVRSLYIPAMCHFSTCEFVYASASITFTFST